MTYVSRPGVLAIPVSEFTESLKEEKIFEVNSFDGLESKYLREKYYQQKFDLMKPVPIILGQGPVWKRIKGHREIKVCDRTAYYLSPLKIAKRLLENPYFVQQVDTNRISTDGVKRDVCDGTIYQEHPVVQRHGPSTLQALVYFDELIVTNPLSSKKHKTGNFYIFFTNISPEKRSRLEAIFAWCVARSTDLKNLGMSKVLKFFVDDMNSFAREGINVTLHEGVDRLFHCAVLGFLGDTLGSQLISGMKEGVGGAFKICRECEATDVDFKDIFRECDHVMRDIESHTLRCEQLSECESRRERELLSMTWGINDESEMNKLDGFNLTTMLPQDASHVIIYGPLGTHIRFLLLYLVNERIFSLAHINSFIFDFDLGPDSNNRPSPITKKQLDKKGNEKLGNQSQTQLWALARMLPFLLFDTLSADNPQLECYLLHLELLAVAFSTEIFENLISWLSVIITEWGTMYSEIFTTDARVPKCHYYLHFPSNAWKYGPLIYVMCMRLEAFHTKMKPFALLSNFRNVPYSVMTRYSASLTLQLLTPPGSPPVRLFGEQLTCGTTTCLDVDSPEVREIASFFPVDILSKSEKLYSLSWVTKHGVKFMPGSIIRTSSREGDRRPHYSTIVAIYSFKFVIYFQATTLYCEDFDQSLMAWPVFIPSQDQNQIIPLKNVVTQHSISIWRVVNRPDLMFIADRTLNQAQLEC
eukprot:Lithocolla_globosa_v1_NODE_1993_length_2220_cov_3.563048.p1 type:complete len:699 gc:universal NODE_1993_length_2220_cov_3.563048:102-2198(+)